MVCSSGAPPSSDTCSTTCCTTSASPSCGEKSVGVEALPGNATERDPRFRETNHCHETNCGRLQSLSEFVVKSIFRVWVALTGIFYLR